MKPIDYSRNLYRAGVGVEEHNSAIGLLSDLNSLNGVWDMLAQWTPESWSAIEHVDRHWMGGVYVLSMLTRSGTVATIAVPSSWEFI